MFLIIGLKINSIHHCKNIDHQNVISARNIIISDSNVSKQHMQQITSTYIICIVVSNLVCMHLFIVYLTLNSDSVPQNIKQYQCSPDERGILKAISGSAILLCYFIIHEIWNLRMISYHHNKHDCTKSKCICLERCMTNKTQISKY